MLNDHPHTRKNAHGLYSITKLNCSDHRVRLYV